MTASGLQTVVHSNSTAQQEVAPLQQADRCGACIYLHLRSLASQAVRLTAAREERGARQGTESSRHHPRPHPWHRSLGPMLGQLDRTLARHLLPAAHEVDYRPAVNPKVQIVTAHPL